MNFQSLPHLSEMKLPTFKLVFFEDNRDVTLALKLWNQYKTQVDICKVEWDALKTNSVYGLTKYQTEFLRNLAGPPSAIFLKGSVIVSSSQYNSFDRFFFESLAEEHIIYIVDSSSNLNKYLLADIAAMAKVKGFDEIGISNLSTLFNQNLQEFCELSSSKKTALHVIQSPTAEEFKKRVSSVFTSSCGFKISVFMGCHVSMNDGIPSLVFKQHKMKMYEFKRWLKSIKMMHSPDICIFFECCNALQVVASCLNQGIMRTFYQLNHFNQIIGLEIPELVHLFNEYKTDQNPVDMVYDNNFNRILSQLELNDVKMHLFLKSFQQEMFSMLKSDSNTIFEHFRSGIRTPFILEAGTSPVVTVHLFPLSVSSIPGIGVISSFLSSSAWQIEDFKLMRKEFISLPVLTTPPAVKDVGNYTIPCQIKKYDSDLHPVLNWEMNDGNRQIIESTSELIPTFLESLVFNEIVTLTENNSTKVSFILPGIQNEFGVIVVAVEDECEIHLKHSFEIGIVVIKAAYEKLTSKCPGKDCHEKIVPGCEIGFFDKGGDPDYGSAGLFAKRDNTNYLLTAGHVFSKSITKKVMHKASYYDLHPKAKKNCKYSPVHIGTLSRCEDTVCHERQIQLDYAIIALLPNISFSNIPGVLEDFQITNWDTNKFEHKDGYGYYICCRSSDSIKELEYYSSTHVVDKSTIEIGFRAKNKNNKPLHGDSGSPVVRYSLVDEKMPHTSIGIFLGCCDNICIMIQLFGIPEINSYDFVVQ